MIAATLLPPFMRKLHNKNVGTINTLVQKTWYGRLEINANECDEIESYFVYFITHLLLLLSQCLRHKNLSASLVDLE